MYVLEGGHDFESVMQPRDIIHLPVWRGYDIGLWLTATLSLYYEGSQCSLFKYMQSDVIFLGTTSLRNIESGDEGTKK